MTIWAIGDLHLSFGISGKEMDVFGEEWVNWTDKVQNYWKESVSEDDLVLIPGDISWAKDIEETLPDLRWIDQLPGTKVMIRGNHDYWWSSITKVRKNLPPSIHVIQNDTFKWKDVSIGGARLWDSFEYNFDDYIVMKDNPRENKLISSEETPEMTEKVFIRELGRLEMSLKDLDQNAKTRIVMTHYPPIGADLEDSRVSALLEKHNVDYCVFGHLHNVTSDSLPFGKKNGVQYVLTSCDYLHCKPIQISP